MSRPGTVTASLILWILSTILGIVGAIVAFIALGTAGALANGAAGGVLIAGAVIALVIAVVQIILLVAFSRGRNWARIVLTILGVIGIIGDISGGTSQQNNYGISWISLVIYVLAIVLAYVGGANAFFRRR